MTAQHAILELGTTSPSPSLDAPCRMKSVADIPPSKAGPLRLRGEEHDSLTLEERPYIYAMI